MEEQQPTIANPFADRGDTRSHPERNPYKSREFTPAKRATIRPITKTAAERKTFQPTFYVSQASRRYLAMQIEKKELTEEELPTIHKIAFYVGKVFKRPTPTISDFEAAYQIRSFDNARAIASGEVKLDIVRNGIKPMEVMPAKQRIEFWQIAAQRLLEEYEQMEGASAPQPEETTPEASQ